MNSMMPVPLPEKWSGNVKVVFTDIDDTLTWEGRLPTETFLALQRLKDAGITVVPVTGACGGWADCIVRTWPIQTIIAENGSFWLHQDQKNTVSRHYWYSEEERQANFLKLKALGEEFQKAYPMIGYTHDQDFRLTDIAFDIGQQVSIDREIALDATDWWLEKGAIARASSIHINVWIGNYSKAAAAVKWLEEQGNIGLEECVFIGDSPNDDTMFARFPTCVGVANIERFLKDMDHRPGFITSQNGGFGFCELADSLLRS